MYEKIVKLLAEQLHVDPATIKPETRLLEDLKADSANLMMLIMDMETELGMSVEDDALMRMKTVGDVVAYAEANKP